MLLSRHFPETLSVTGRSSPPLLLCRHRDRRPRRFPVDLHRAGAVGLVKGDGEILYRRRELRSCHLHPRQIVRFAGIGNSPLAGLLADDQRPLVRIGNGKHRVASSRNGLAPQRELRVGDQCGGFIRTQAPDLSHWHQVAENLAPLHPRARVIHGNSFALGQLAGGLRRWAGALALVLWRGQRGACESGDTEENGETWCTLLHGISLGSKGENILRSYFSRPSPTGSNPRNSNVIGRPALRIPSPTTDRR